MSFSRREFLAASAAAPLMAQRRQASGAPPNVLLIVADDLAAWMTGVYGNKEIRTPNIDTLARGGTRFINHFVCTPICSASRATLFTGRTPRQHGIVDFLTPQPVDDPPQGQKDPPPSFANEIMISDLLAKQGYDCGYVGKWHMGNDDKPGHAYTYTYTMPGGSSPYQNPKMFLNGEARQETGYLTDLMTQRAVEFIDRQKTSQPFFLTVGYFNPHTPYDGLPQKYYDMYAKSTFESFGYQPMASNALREKGMFKDFIGNVRKCAASVTSLDDQIPALTRRLQQKGLYDNTLIIFTGDNGFLLGRHGLWSKGLASNPINMYDEVMAVPMLWSWPGRVPAEGARPELVSFYDFLPSICEVTGAPVPSRNLPGRSYAGLAMGRPLPKKQPWRSTVFGQFRNTSMAREKRFKLVSRNEGKGPNEFFDISTDPREMRNQYDSPEYVTVRDELAKQLENWTAKYSS